MNSLPLLIFIALIGGIAVSLQGQFMGLIDQRLGTLESVFITYVSGAVIITLVMLLLRGGNLSAWRSLPGYTLTTGLLGLLLVGAISFSVPRLGLTSAFTLLIAAQYLATAVIEHFGLFGAPHRPLDLIRLLGMAVVIFGVWLITRR